MSAVEAVESVGDSAAEPVGAWASGVALFEGPSDRSDPVGALSDVAWFYAP